MKNLLRSKIILLALAPLIIFLLNILLLRFFGVGVSTSATAPLEYLFKLFPPPDPRDMDSYIRHIKRLAIFGEQSSAFFVYSLVLPFIAIGTKRAILKRIVFILAALSIGTAHSFTQQSTIQLQMSLGRLFIAGLLALDAFLFACVLKLLFGKPEWWKAILRIAFAVLVVTLAASYAFEVSAIGAFSMLKGVDVLAYIAMATFACAYAIENSPDFSSKLIGSYKTLTGLLILIVVPYGLLSRQFEINPGEKLAGKIPLTINLSVLEDFADDAAQEKLFKYLQFNPEWDMDQYLSKGRWKAEMREKQGEIYVDATRFAFGEGTTLTVEINNHESTSGMMDQMENYKEIEPSSASIEVPVMVDSILGGLRGDSKAVALKFASTTLNLKIRATGKSPDVSLIQQKIDKLRIMLIEAKSLEVDKIAERFAYKGPDAGRCFFTWDPAEDGSSNVGKKINIWGYFNAGKAGTLKAAVNDKPTGFMESGAPWSSKAEEVFYFYAEDRLKADAAATEPTVEVYFEPERDYHSIKSQSLTLLAKCSRKSG